MIALSGAGDDRPDSHRSCAGFCRAVYATDALDYVCRFLSDQSTYLLFPLPHYLTTTPSLPLVPRRDPAKPDDTTTKEEKRKALPTYSTVLYGRVATPTIYGNRF